MRRVIKRIVNFRRNQGGQALAEVLITFPIMLTLVGILLQYTIISIGKFSATYAAWTGVRAIIQTSNREMAEKKVYDNVCNAVDTVWAYIYNLTWSPVGIPVPPDLMDMGTSFLKGLGSAASGLFNEGDIDSLGFGKDLVIMEYRQGSGGIGSTGGIKPGYYQRTGKDGKTRWHRPNGQFAKAGEEKAGGREVHSNDTISPNSDVSVEVRYRMAMFFPLVRFVFGDRIGKDISVDVPLAGQQTFTLYAYHFPFCTVTGIAFGRTPREESGSGSAVEPANKDKIKDYDDNGNFIGGNNG